MSRSKTDKSLEKYSKADLIWIIKAMLTIQQTYRKAQI